MSNIWMTSEGLDINFDDPTEEIIKVHLGSIEGSFISYEQHKNKLQFQTGNRYTHTPLCPGKRDAISGPRPTYPTDPTNPPRSVRMAPGDSKHPGVGGLTQIPTPRGTL